MKFQLLAVVVALLGGGGCARIDGTPGDDILKGSASEADQIYGHAGNDRIIGAGNGDTLIGGEGDDHLSCPGTETTYIGGPGNDVIECRQYIAIKLSAGDGHDVVRPVARCFVTLVYDSSVAASDIAPRSYGSFLSVNNTATGDSIVFEDYYLGVNDVTAKIYITFDDGTAWDEAQILKMSGTVTGTPGDDVLVGNNRLSHWAYGLAGDDAITVNGCTDELHGAGGDDKLTATGGGARCSSLQFLPYGTTRATFVGGPGNDVLTFSGAYKHYVFNFSARDGDDTLVSSYRFDTLDWSDTIRIQFDASVAPADIAITRDSRHNPVIRNTATGSTITMEVPRGLRYTTVAFTDGTKWDGDVRNGNGYLIKAYAVINGTSGDDVLAGGYIGFDESDCSADRIYGLAGNDIITGTGCDDVLYGGEGDDRLGLTDGLVAPHTEFVGGPGNDMLSGSPLATSENYYRFSRGDGNDIIEASENGKDIIIFGTSVASADVAVARDSSQNLVLRNVATGDTVTLHLGRNLLKHVTVTFLVEGAADTKWSGEDLGKARAVINGTSGDDSLVSSGPGKLSLYGFAGNDHITGRDGDELYGGEGNDHLRLAHGVGGATFVGGPGNDVMVGGQTGGDVYRFSAGDGADVIARSAKSLIVFDNTVGHADITVVNNNGHVVISNSATGDTVTVQEGTSSRTSVSIRFEGTVVREMKLGHWCCAGTRVVCAVTLLARGQGSECRCKKGFAPGIDVAKVSGDSDCAAEDRNHGNSGGRNEVSVAYVFAAIVVAATVLA